MGGKYMKYLLDTHVWIWWNMNPDKLSQKVLSAISRSEHYTELLLSAISIWEFCKLLEKKRLSISCEPFQWIEQALELPKFRLVALTPSIAYHSTILPQPFHEDPADQIIAATAREENAVLISKDERLRKYGQLKSLW
jgi:PIN domain nuclease of toxin-antitoxin system